MYGLSGIDFIENIGAICSSDLNTDEVIKFADVLNIGIEHKAPILKAAINYVTVGCETDYIFSARELEWIDFVVDICELNIGNNRLLIVAKVECNPKDYYLHCAALVKLLSHVKQEESFFVFVFDEGIAFGCKRFYDQDIENNFCVSSYIEFDNVTQTLGATDEDFLYNLMISEWEDYPLIIRNNSPNEQESRTPHIDRLRFDPDYISFLYEISAKYGVDTSRQVEEYKSSFEERSQGIITYREASELLRSIGEDSKTSYEVLDAAEEAAVKAQNITSYNDDNNSLDDSELANSIINQFSEAAFNNAEMLLKEIMNIDK